MLRVILASQNVVSYPDLSVMKKLAAEHQNRTNMLLWLSARKKNCWASVFKMPWTVFRESEMDFRSRTFWKKASVCAVPSKTTYLSLPLNFSVPALVIGKHVIGSSLTHCLCHALIYQTGTKNRVD